LNAVAGNCARRYQSGGWWALLAFVRRVLAGVAVSAVMDAVPESVSPELMVNFFVLDQVMRRSGRAMPVVDHGQLVGIISITDARRLVQDGWPITRVGEIMTHIPLKTLSRDADLAAALQLMVESSVQEVPIVDGAALLGLVSQADVVRYLQMGSALRQRSPASTPTIAPTPKPVPSQG
jgi:predicted transcriptional regulator